MPIKFTNVLQGLSIFFSGLSILNDSLDDESPKKKSTRRVARYPRTRRYIPASARRFGAVYGDPVEAAVRKTAQELKSQPVVKTEVSPRNIHDRVRYIDKMIRKYREDPRIREIGAAILTKKCAGRGGKYEGSWCVAEKDWYGEIDAVFSELRKRVRFTRDVISKDTYQSPKRTIAQFNIGDCDDFTISLGSVLQSVGYPLKIRIIQTVPNDDFNHVYLMVGVPPMAPRDWIAADASVPEPLGFQAPSDIVIKVRDYTVKST